MPLPDGRVDPAAADEVAAVLGAVQTTMGAEGLADLLARLPGVVREAGRAKTMFRAATPDRIWLGPEDAIALAAPLVHEQVVGGVVLHRAALPAGTAPGALAGLVTRLTASTGATDAVSIALTAAREAAERF